MSKKQTSKKTGTKAAAKKAPAKSATRIDSAALTVYGLKKAMPVADLVAAADKAYTAEGGKANPKESLWAVGKVISTMEALGIVSVADGAVEVIGKVVAK